MVLIKQPTRTSCGPTCVAMLTGAPVETVIGMLRKHRPGRHTDGARVQDLALLLGHFGQALGASTWVRSGFGDAHGLVEWHHRTPAGQYRRGWHCLVVSGGLIYDPESPAPVPATQWFAARHNHKLILHPVSAAK